MTDPDQRDHPPGDLFPLMFLVLLSAAAWAIVGGVLYVATEGWW